MIVEYNIKNEEGILIQAKGNFCSKLKKGKLKIKKLFKITILDEQEPSVQSKDNQSSASLKLMQICIYQNLEWNVAVTALVYLKINSGFHAPKNPKEQYLKAVKSSDASFSEKRIYVYDCSSAR